jgi:hypothetical protein
VNTKLEHPCEDCGTPVSLRRKRCPECKKDHHAQVMRERRAAESGQQSYDPENSLLGQTVIDYTVPGAASRPPMHETHRQPRRELVTDEVVDYMTADSGPRFAATSKQIYLSGVPGALRHDLVQAQKEARDLAAATARDQAADDEPELSSWQPGRGQVTGRTINVQRPTDRSPVPYDAGPRITNLAAAGQLYGPPRVPAAAVLGHAVTVARPRPQRPNLAAPQKTPAIIN